VGALEAVSISSTELLRCVSFFSPLTTFVTADAFGLLAEAVVDLVLLLPFLADARRLDDGAIGVTVVGLVSLLVVLLVLALTPIPAAAPTPAERRAVDAPGRDEVPPGTVLGFGFLTDTVV
jgi:hypothetical protein